MKEKSNLTRVAVGGTAWLIGSSVIIQSFSLVAQIVLGWLLSQHDFGLYALAIGVASCLQVFRDGGVSLWLARQSRTEFTGNAVDGFWLCLASSICISVLLLALAPIMASVYGQPLVGWLVAVIAFSLPLDTYGVIAEADLQVALRFQALSCYRTMSSLVRYALTIGFAWAGWGPMSFVLPLIPVAIVRLLYGYGLTRFVPWNGWPRWKQVWVVFRESRWVFSGTFASSVFRQIDYLTLGLVASTATVGIYFFAFQLTIQPVLLFGQSLRRVLIPTFSRAGRDAERRQRAIVRTAGLLGLIGSGLFLLLSMVAGLVERSLWQGNWEVAVPAIRWLAAAMPLHLFALLARMLAQADGRFRLWGATVVCRSVGLVVVVLVAAMVWRNQAIYVAAAVAIYFAISGLAEAAYILRRLSINPWPVLEMVVPPYLFAISVALLASFLVTLVPWSSEVSGTAPFSNVLRATLYGVFFSLGMGGIFKRQTSEFWRLIRLFG